MRGSRRCELRWRVDGDFRCKLTGLMIRAAAAGDVPAILNLVRELADYQGAADSVSATEDDLRLALCGPEPGVFAEVAEDQRGEVVGYALWYLSFSPWLGRHGIFIADLYVRRSHRGGGLGRALLSRLAELCLQRGYGRMEWKAQQANSDAAGFYASIGAELREGWSLYELRGATLNQLADKAATA